MDRLIYTAISGMNASMARERMIASNMANAQTLGFRAETMQFTPQTIVGQDPAANLEVRSMSSSQVHGALMKAGSLTQTGNELDIAMASDALLTVQASDGGEGYPALARSVYYTTRERQVIREELYAAVASVLAFVFSLKRGEHPSAPAIDVPVHIRFDAEGRLDPKAAA